MDKTQFALRRRPGTWTSFDGWEFEAAERVATRLKRLIIEIMENNLDVVFSEDGISGEMWLTACGDDDISISVKLSAEGDEFADFTISLLDLAVEESFNAHSEMADFARRFRAIADKLDAASMGQEGGV